jgi:hypothetical protein
VIVSVYVPAGVPEGVTVRAAGSDVPANDAVMVTGVDAVTAVVFTVNVVLVAPAGIATLLGTVAAAALLDNVTTAPPLGAGLLRVTVPVEDVPPLTEAGLRVRDDRATVPDPPPLLHVVLGTVGWARPARSAVMS